MRWERAVCVPALLLSIATTAWPDSRPEDFDAGMRALTAGNFAEAYCRWRPLADRGYAEAQYHVGWLYANGNGLALDIERALEFWRAAAEQGHADAQFAVGLAYTTGEGLEKDIAEAVDWYLRAARQGHRDARDILIRLNGDESIKLLERHPELSGEDWFGWNAAVLGKRINVRGGPGKVHRIIGHLERGETVRVIGSHGDWFMAVLPEPNDVGDENIAWIYKTLLSTAGR